MTESGVDIPKLGESLTEVNLKLDEAKDIFYESLKKFESVRKCMSDHEQILDSFRSGVVNLGKELDESKKRIVSDTDKQKSLESTILSLEKKIGSQVGSYFILKADYKALEDEKDQLVQ